MKTRSLSAAESAGFRPCRRCRPATVAGAAAALSRPVVATRRLPYRPPFDWAALLRFLALRATPGVEVVAEGCYRRTIEVAGASGALEVRLGTGRPHVLVRVWLAPGSGLDEVVRRVRRIFDLAVDPLPIVAHLRRSHLLRARLDAMPGLRVPGAWDGFELAVRAVLGQQVTVKGATTLAGRLVRAFGTPVEGMDDGLSHLFPPPAVLARADLSAIGMPRARAATVRALAEAVADGRLALDRSRGLDDAVQRLCAIPGIGAWTAHYVAMRALGERDAFPATDLGLRRALGGGAISAREIERRAEAWRPWRSYAAMSLWMSRGESRGDARDR